MGSAKVVCAIFGTLVSLATLSCASVVNWLDRPFRVPGERLRDFPEEVWKEYECDSKELPFFQIERLELYPRRLEPGEEFGHRLVYAMCPVRTTAVVTGQLETRILYRGKPIPLDLDKRYDLRPGRWVVDTFVTLPKSAEVGIYALDLRFTSSQIQFQRTLEFAVDPPDPP